jgi:hypothetical protein
MVQSAGLGIGFRHLAFTKRDIIQMIECLRLAMEEIKIYEAALAGGHFDVGQRALFFSNEMLARAEKMVKTASHSMLASWQEMQQAYTDTKVPPEIVGPAVEEDTPDDDDEGGEEDKNVN